MKTIPNLETIQSLYPETEAVFFDMDGTLFNTEPVHGEAIKKIVDLKAPNAISVEEINHRFAGYLDHMVYDDLKAEDLIPEYMTWSDFLATKNNHMLEMIEDLNEENFPSESRSLLDEIKESPLKMGLVTSSERLITDAMLNHFELADHFDHTLTRDDVSEYKPNPRPYLESIKKLEVNGKNSVILEDSNAGLAAAKASGAQVIEARWFH